MWATKVVGVLALLLPTGVSFFCFFRNRRSKLLEVVRTAFVAVVFLVVLHGSATHAALVTWNFTARVTFDNNSPFDVGDTLSGQISFQKPPTYPLMSDTTTYSNAATGYSFGPYRSIDGTVESHAIVVRNNGSRRFGGGTWDDFVFSYEFGLQRFYFELGTNTNLTAIDSLELPVIPYDLNLFTTRRFTYYDNGFLFQADLLSLSPSVPEPSTWTMMVAGFAGAGFLALYRRRHKSPTQRYRLGLVS